jgi:hypothetical protein
MQQRHYKAYNFLATYERILWELEWKEIPSPNDIDYFIRHLKVKASGRYIKETAPTPRVYKQTQVGYTNMLTRLHYMEWTTIKDISLYNFMLSQIDLPFATREEITPDTRLIDIDVPTALMCSDQKYIYHI